MSLIGYNGEIMTFEVDDVTIAAISTTTETRNKEAVDVTTRDSAGWRVLLPTPGSRSIDASIEGVATSANITILRDAWAGNLMLDGAVVAGDGSKATAANGFFFQNLELSGEKGGYVAFTATLLSSGAITDTPAA